jgi:hypothetical protein
MAGFAFDLKTVYNSYFAGAYNVGKAADAPAGLLPAIPAKGEKRKQTIFGQELYRTNAQGREIFLPVKLSSPEARLQIDCCTIRVTGKKTIISTPVSERKGTVKEVYNIGDWQFSIKGVLIGAGGEFPDNEIEALRSIFESFGRVELDNALADIFLDTSKRVCMIDIDLDSKQGRSFGHQPFTLSCESDFIDTLIIEG